MHATATIDRTMLLSAFWVMTMIILVWLWLIENPAPLDRALRRRGWIRQPEHVGADPHGREQYTPYRTAAAPAVEVRIYAGSRTWSIHRERETLGDGRGRGPLLECLRAALGALTR